MKVNSTVVCSICGYDFDPSGHAACTSCPLNNGCHMVCCPSCGSSNIDPAQSTLVRWISKWIGEKKHGVTPDLQK